MNYQNLVPNQLFQTDNFTVNYITPFKLNNNLFTFVKNKLFSDKNLILQSDSNILNLLLINKHIYIHTKNCLQNVSNNVKIVMSFPFSFSFKNQVFFASVTEIFKFQNQILTSIGKSKTRFNCQIGNLLVNQNEVYDFLSQQFLQVQPGFNVKFDGEISYIDGNMLVSQNYNLNNKIIYRNKNFNQLLCYINFETSSIKQQPLKIKLFEQQIKDINW